MSKLEKVRVRILHAPVSRHFEKHLMVFPGENQSVVDDAPAFLDTVDWFFFIVYFLMTEIVRNVFSIGSNTDEKRCILFPHNLNRPARVFPNRPSKRNRRSVGAGLNNQGEVLHVSGLGN